MNQGNQGYQGYNYPNNTNNYDQNIIGVCPPYVPSPQNNYNLNNPNYSTRTETYTTTTTTGSPYNQGFSTSNVSPVMTGYQSSGMNMTDYGNNMGGVTSTSTSQTIVGTGNSNSRVIVAPTIYNKAPIQQPPVQTSVQYIPYQTKQIVYDTVEKREIVPIQKTITEYEQLKHIETIPVEKSVTDYYAVEHRTDYIPTVTSERVTDYIQQEVINEHVNYRPVDRQRVIGNTGSRAASEMSITTSTVTPGYTGQQGYNQYSQQYNQEYSQQYGQYGQQQYGQGIGLTGPAVMTGSGVGSIVQPINQDNQINQQLANGARNNSLF